MNTPDALDSATTPVLAPVTLPAPCGRCGAPAIHVVYGRYFYQNPAYHALCLRCHTRDERLVGSRLGGWEIVEVA